MTNKSIKKFNNFNERFLSAFTSLDFIGPQFVLQNNSSERFQSVQGSFWSLFAVFLVILSGFMFGKEIYERQTPRTNTNRENIEYSNIYFREFPLMFTLTTPSGKFLTNDNFRNYLTPYIKRIDYDSNGKLTIDNKIKDFKQCDINMFTKFKDEISEKITESNNKYLCLDFDSKDYFSNTIFALNSTNYNIGFKICRDNKEHNITCASDKDFVLQDLLLDVIYVTSFVNLQNYLNPISKYLEHLTTQLDLTLFRRSYMRFIYNLLSTDYGWFIDSLSNEEIPYLESLVPDDLALINEGQYKDLLFLLSVESPKSRMKFSRSYLKIQELLANLGGLTNFIILSVRILSDSHLSFVMCFFIKDVALATFEKQDLENSLSNNYDINKAIKINKINNNLNNNIGSLHLKPTKLSNLNNLSNTKTLNKKNIDKKNESSLIELKNVDNIQTIIKIDNIKNKAVNNEYVYNNINNYTKLQEKTSKRQQDINSENASNNKESKSIKNLNDNQLIHNKDMLNFMNKKLSFYTPSIVNNLKTSFINPSFIEYMCAIICKNKDKIRKYDIILKSIRKIISIHSYTDLIVRHGENNSNDINDL